MTSEELRTAVQRIALNIDQAQQIRREGGLTANCTPSHADALLEEARQLAWEIDEDARVRVERTFESMRIVRTHDALIETPSHADAPIVTRHDGCITVW